VQKQIRGDTKQLFSAYQHPIITLSSPTMVGVGTEMVRCWYGVGTVLIGIRYWESICCKSGFLDPFARNAKTAYNAHCQYVVCRLDKIPYLFVLLAMVNLDAARIGV